MSDGCYRSDNEADDPLTTEERLQLAYKREDILRAELAVSKRECERLKSAMKDFVEQFDVLNWDEEPWDKIEAYAVSLWKMPKEHAALHEQHRQVVRLLREAADTVEASTAEDGISDDRLKYRRGLLDRIRAHLVNKEDKP